MNEPATPQPSADTSLAPIDENSASSAPVFVEHLDSEEGALADVFANALSEHQQGQTPPPPPVPDTPPSDPPPPAVPSDSGLQPPQPTPQPAPAPAYDTDQYEEVDPDEIARKARLAAERAAAGRFGGEKQRLMAEIAALKAQLAAGAQPPSQPSQPAQQPQQPSVPPQDANAPVTDQELTAVCGPRWESVYTREDAEAEVRKQRAIQAFYGQPRSAISPQDVDAIVDRRVQQIEAARRSDDFRSRVLAPEGFAELERNARTNGFADFLDSPMPDTSMTRRDVINIALWQMGQSSDPSVFDKAVETVQGFYRQFAARNAPKPPAQRPAGAVIDPSRYIAPSAPSGGSSAPASPGKYSQKQIDDYLQKANAAGAEAYEKALTWFFEQDAAGHIAR